MLYKLLQCVELRHSRIGMNDHCLADYMWDQWWSMLCTLHSIAGLEDVCTHVESTIFCIETSTRLYGKVHAQGKCVNQWYLTLVSFTAAYCMEKYRSCFGRAAIPKRIWKSTSGRVSTPDGMDIEKVYSSIRECGTKPAIKWSIHPKLVIINQTMTFQNTQNL